MANPGKSESLRSGVRPFISIVFTLGVWAAFFMGKMEGDVLLGIYGTIIGFWFGERSALKAPQLKDILPGIPGVAEPDPKVNNGD